MNLPETCPFCGAGVLVMAGGFECRNGRWVTFDCRTSIHSGQAERRTQSRTCEDAERARLAARVAELEVDNKAMRDRIAKLEDCIETAWGIIANAGGGDWNTQTPKWKEAAESWRDNKFHPILNDTFTVRAKVEGGAR